MQQEEPSMLALGSFLTKYESEAGVVLSRKGEALELQLSQGSIQVRVLVPHNVLEWFVEVHFNNGRVAEDWCDYEGYDHTPRSELEGDMEQDIQRFAEALCANKLRVRGNILEYENGSSWSQLVPFIAHAA